MTRNKTATAFVETEDIMPPFVQIIKPTNAVYIFNNAIFPSKKPIIVEMINIKVNAIDNESGINRVAFYIDNSSLGDDTTIPYAYYWEDSFSGYGEQTIKVIAYDNAGNSASTEIQVFTWRYPLVFLILFLAMMPIFVLAHLLP
jgi:hypothetical protein